MPRKAEVKPYWAWIGLPLLLLGSNAEASDATRGAPVYHGRFAIHYMPIFCKRAPCPRGSYVVSAGRKRLADVKQIEVDGATPPAQRSFVAAFRWGNEPLAVDGDAWLPPGRSVVVIHADRAIEGEWKP